VTLLRALLQGFGWRVGKEVAEEAIRKAIEGEPAPPEPTPEELAKAAKARAKAAEAARRAAEKKASDDAKAVERELAALKKRVRR
jgi:hypothetical protein